MIAVGVGDWGELPAASLPLPGCLPPWTAFCIRGRPFLHHADLRGFHLDRVQQQHLDSSVLWVLHLPTPNPHTLHPNSSSSGFTIPFSAASCTKLCCDCAGRPGPGKESTAKPLPLRPPNDCRLCTLYPFHLLYLTLKSVYCKEAGRKVDTISNCTVI